jgi:hypothetical protein
MTTELVGFCMVEKDCLNVGTRQLCGHMACDDHTDSTGLCGWCVPSEQERAEALAERLRGAL